MSNSNSWVERLGRHEELLALNGTYATLWRKQAGMLLSDDGFQARIEPAKLASIPILSGLDESQLGQIAPLFVTDNVPAGRTLMQQGDPGDRFYLIVRGKVEVLIAAGEEAPRRAAVLEDGDFFGEVALLRNTPRNATVRTLAPSTFLTLTRGQFADLMTRLPSVREAIETAQAARV